MFKYTLIHQFFSFYDMGVQKRGANDNDIINYQEKRKSEWQAFKREGERNSGARVCAFEGEISKFSFPSPHATENLFPFQKTAMRAKDDSKRLESLSEGLFAKKLCEHVKLEYIREIDVAGR